MEEWKPLAAGDGERGAGRGLVLVHFSPNLSQVCDLNHPMCPTEVLALSR